MGMSRILAFLILLIPGIIATFGIKLMRDTIFQILHPPLPVLWLQFFIGFLLFLFGSGFIGGYIFYRDKKRDRVKNRRLSR